ncbi:MAG: hypothetical protein FWG68_03185 [Defluviitaleaceae bacterium]|nr:hypothetical protein [Defluviitaleaceae bacterium]
MIEKQPMCRELTIREERALEERAIGFVKGQIYVYHNEMNLPPSQIAHKLNLPEEHVSNIIQQNDKVEGNNTPPSILSSHKTAHQPPE